MKVVLALLIYAAVASVVATLVIWRMPRDLARYPEPKPFDHDLAIRTLSALPLPCDFPHPTRATNPGNGITTSA